MPQATSHYQDRHEHYEGAVVMFRRGDSFKQGRERIWQARFKLEGMTGFKTVSLKTAKYEDAYARARELYLRFQQMVREGAALRERTFDQAWHEWFKQMLAEGVWTESRQRWHRNYFNRYFHSYFGGKKLDDITMEFAQGYWTWRKRYWVDGDGANQIEYNRRRARLGNKTTHNAAREVAHKTLLMEKSALNQIFSWCYSHRRFMRYAIKVKVPSSSRHQRNEGRRATFTDHEWVVLTRNLQSWADGKGKYARDKLNEYHRHHRQQLRYFILFIGSTGIRPGTETRFMRWEDVTEFKDKNGQELLQIRIRRTSKKGVSRTVVSQPSAVAWMKDWRTIRQYPGDQQLIWYGISKAGQAQKASTDLNKTFKTFLKTVACTKGKDTMLNNDDVNFRKDGLLNDVEGNRRSLYSIRHFYAGQRIRAGVSYEDLRRTMGTGIPQLVRHYDDTTSVQKAAEITKTNFNRKRHDIDRFIDSLTAEQLTELQNRLVERSAKD